MIKAFKLLFRSSDQICVGDHYATDVGPQPISPVAQFYSINPLHGWLDHVKAPNGEITAIKGPGRRADLNVTRFQNFLFEMDNVPLDQQLNIILTCGFPWATVTYSGGKSYHAILSLEQALDAKPHTQEGVDEYKRVWKQLAAVLCQRAGRDIKILDSSTQNPSRLSRTPGAVRGTKVQELVKLGRLCSAEELRSILAEAPEIEKPRYAPRTNAVSRTEEEMRLMLPAELSARLKFPATWAQGAAGNYPLLLKLVLWAYDSTGVSKEILTSYMKKHTFPGLIRLGYPEDKIYKAIDDAYAMKGES